MTDPSTCRRDEAAPTSLVSHSLCHKVPIARVCQTRTIGAKTSARVSRKGGPVPKSFAAAGDTRSVVGARCKRPLHRESDKRENVVVVSAPVFCGNARGDRPRARVMVARKRSSWILALVVLLGIGLLGGAWWLVAAGDQLLASRKRAVIPAGGTGEESA